MVEIRERVQEILVPKYVEVAAVAPAKPLLFAHLSDEALLSYGVPAEWMRDVRAADEDTLLTSPTIFPPKLRRRCWN